MSQSKKLFRIYIEDGVLQDKALYIKKVMDSCQTVDQLLVAANWGKETFKNWVLTLTSCLKRKERNTVLFLGADLGIEIETAFQEKYLALLYENQ